MTGAVAAAAMALPSDASAVTHYSCSLSGQAGTSPPVQLTGGVGTYAFDSEAPAVPGVGINCLVISSWAGVDVQRVALRSNGSYANTVCGTGTADSTGNTIVAVAGANPTLVAYTRAQAANLDYHIQFLAMHGELTFTSGPGNATGGGPVNISDPTPGNTGSSEGGHGPSDCTSDFQVNGSLDFFFLTP